MGEQLLAKYFSYLALHNDVPSYIYKYIHGPSDPLPRSSLLLSDQGRTRMLLMDGSAVVLLIGGFVAAATLDCQRWGFSRLVIDQHSVAAVGM